MNVLFPKPSLAERNALVRILHSETVGGILMLSAAVLALIWANSPLQSSYDTFRHFAFGPESLHLRLDVVHWVQDGLLAIFFTVAGLELRRELTHGDLKDPRNAALPIVAALGGMLIPAVLYLIATIGDVEGRSGWAIPMATDIAFALAVLAVVGRNLPSALRAFLLTLAIVDDLVAILVIAIFFSKSLHFMPLLASIALLGIYAFTQRQGWTAWWIALPIALGAWATLHASGVHATVAGVAVGVLTSNRRIKDRSAEERYEDILRPVSAGLAVPLFALVSAGVPVSLDFFRTVFTDQAAIGVIVGLVLGKIIGVTGGAYLVARFTRAELNPELKWSDIFGVSCVSGIGFTVSLLIASLAFSESDRTQHIIAAVLLASLLATVLASVVLRRRSKFYQLEA